MIPIIGQPELIGLQNRSREIICKFCGNEQTVGQAMGNSHCCHACDSLLCVYCGCTDDAGCVHEDFPNGNYICSWTQPGVCSFCHFKICEEIYLMATGREDVVKDRYEAKVQLY